MNYVLEYLKGFLGFTSKDSKLSWSHYIISFKNTGLKDIKPEDVKEFGKFNIYGTSGVALQGSSELVKDDLQIKLAQKFNVPREKIVVITPIIFMGLRGWLYASRHIMLANYNIKGEALCLNIGEKEYLYWFVLL